MLVILNGLVNENWGCVRHRTLDTCLYRSGLYFKSPAAIDARCRAKKAVMIHNNYIVGGLRKIEHFKVTTVQLLGVEFDRFGVNFDVTVFIRSVACGRSMPKGVVGALYEACWWWS